MSESQFAFLRGLEQTRGFGPVRIREEVSKLNDSELKFSNQDVNITARLHETYAWCKKSGITILTLFDKDYPRRLLEIRDPLLQRKS
jgi:predicted Rossmann fold nucleotide-binding protein DprA/Smf involved in DNA uptake